MTFAGRTIAALLLCALAMFVGAQSARADAPSPQSIAVEQSVVAVQFAGVLGHSAHDCDGLAERSCSPSCDLICGSIEPISATYRPFQIHQVARTSGDATTIPIDETSDRLLEPPKAMSFA